MSGVDHSMRGGHAHNMRLHFDALLRAARTLSSRIPASPSRSRHEELPDSCQHLLCAESTETARLGGLAAKSCER